LKGATIAKKTFAVILVMILLIMGLAGCSGSKTTIKISASPRKYSPVMSSVQGIKLSITNPIEDEDIMYVWKTTDGSFILGAGYDNVTEYTTDSVLWCCLLSDTDNTAGEITKISVIAKNRKTGKEIAAASISIRRDDKSHIRYLCIVLIVIYIL